MSQALSVTEPPPARVTPPPFAPPILVVAEASHPRRGEIETFIEARFDRAFGARLPRHYPILIGLWADDGGDLQAAAGVRFAEDEPLFLERYLDGSVEQAIAVAFGRPISRGSIVEIGSLASDSPEASLRLFGALSAWLAAEHGRRFAVATARPELERLLVRAGFGLLALGPADPDRLGEGASDWGSYYDRTPRVFAGEIGVSTALPLLRQRLRARTMARAVRRLRRVTP